MLVRLPGVAVGVLASAVAIYVAVRLIESVATQLVVIGGCFAVMLMLLWVFRVLWRRQRANRW